MPKKPAQTAPKAPAAERFNKSAMTNDPLKLEDVDGRTTAGRRLRDLIASLTALVAKDGEPLDDVSAAWVRLAAAGTLRGEQIAAAIGRGEAVKDEDLVRIQNASARTMKELRELKASRDGAKPFNMREHLASLDTEPDADDDADDENDGTFELPTFDDEPAYPVLAPIVAEPAMVDAVQTPPATAPVEPVRSAPAPATPHKLRVALNFKTGGVKGRTLFQIVDSLLVDYPGTQPIDVAIPGESVCVSLAEATTCRLAGHRAHDAQWFLQ